MDKIYESGNTNFVDMRERNSIDAQKSMLDNNISLDIIGDTYYRSSYQKHKS